MDFQNSSGWRRRAPGGAGVENCEGNGSTKVCLVTMLALDIWLCNLCAKFFFESHVCLFPKALRRVLPENPLNTDASPLTLRHLHFDTYTHTHTGRAKASKCEVCQCQSMQV